ncbi:MAG: bile acid:sodium symporter, partial [Verrucomicrobiae bacterium]|nr:bile acid:sodium symporter [Verrucomicrobiae bacterium]
MTPILKKYWFILALFVAVALAFQFPEWGQRGGKLHSETTTEFGIILVFLIQGWLLPTEVLARCVFNWKVHLFIQLFVFLVFPLLALGGDNLWGPVLPQNLRTGFFFLAVLPTTITSAVIYTSQAGGNTATALANTTISNLAGVVITPLWMTLLVSSADTTTGDLGPVFWKLTKLILIPSFFGQIGHLFCKSALPYIRTPGQYLNQSIIIFIVFAAFSNSVAGGVWKGLGADIVVTTSFICLVLYAVGNGLSLWSSRVLGFS